MVQLQCSLQNSSTQLYSSVSTVMDILLILKHTKRWFVALFLVTAKSVLTAVMTISGHYENTLVSDSIVKSLVFWQLISRESRLLHRCDAF